MQRSLDVATSNIHKIRELSALLPGWELRMATTKVVESGGTFLDNALLKARAAFRGEPVLAEDSGLCVRALGGRPGVRSARFGQEELGRLLSDEEKNAFLLSLLAGEADRFAYYVCAMAVLWSQERFVVVQEIWEGFIVTEPRGTGGFGYDPVFQPLGMACTSAELSAEEKNRLSHRGRALRRLLPILDSLRDG